jgi:hypothetical protein
MGTAAYDKRNTRLFHLKLNLKTDADIIMWLESQDSMQGAIKRLIREEIEKLSAPEPEKPVSREEADFNATLELMKSAFRN